MHICSFKTISELIEKYEEYRKKEFKKDNLNEFNKFLCNNIWNYLCTITIVILQLSEGKKYIYTIPPHILHELKDSNRLVIDYQCKCFEKFPNFTWMILWEYIH